MSDKFKKVLEDLQILIEDAEGNAFILGKQEGQIAADGKNYKRGYDIGYKQGRIDQAAVEQSSREGSASTTKAAFARGYKKGHKHGKSQGYQLGTQDIISASKMSYKEGRMAGYEEGEINGKAIANVVLRKAYLEGRYEGYKEGSAGQAAELKSKPEPEHATSQEADAGLNEPPDFADLIGYLTEEERRAEHRGV